MKTLLARYLQRRFAWLFFSLLITIGANPALEALLRFNPLELLLAINLVAAIASAARPCAAGFASSQGWGPPQTPPLRGVGALFRSRNAAADQPARVAGGNDVGDRSDRSLRAASLEPWIASTCSRRSMPISWSLGSIFGVGYSLLDHLAPGSFGGLLDLAGGFYFSFVTLATLGYGDIVPVSDTARGLAIVEAVAGQMYLAVLVARLVSLYSQKSEGADPASAYRRGVILFLRAESSSDMVERRSRRAGRAAGTESRSRPRAGLRWVASAISLRIARSGQSGSLQTRNRKSSELSPKP